MALSTNSCLPSLPNSSSPAQYMLVDLPEELVKISMLHVLKDHDKRIALNADTIELDNVLVLQVSQQLCLTVEVLAGIVTGILQCLAEETRM